MKIKNHIWLLVICCSFFFGCNKENSETELKTFVKVVEIDGRYLSRNVLALEDGSVVISCVGIEKDVYAPPFLIKLDAQGQAQWRVELPEEVYALWTCRQMRNGNYLLLGYDAQFDSQQAGVVIVSPDGEILNIHSFLNQTITFGGGDIKSHIDGMELHDGTIGVVMPTITASNSDRKLRLMIFDQSLQVLIDNVYEPIETKGFYPLTLPSLDQSPSGELIVHCRTIPELDDTILRYAAVLAIDPTTYDLIYCELFSTGEKFSSSRMVSSVNGEAVWISNTPSTSILYGDFNVCGQEIFSLGTSFQCWKTTEGDNQSFINSISGFPKNTIIQNLNRCKDGGYILTGTCNINTDQTIPSSYRILLVKLNASLQIEWFQVPDTNSSALGFEAIEIPGGFLVSGTHYTIEGIEQPLIFKTNSEGRIQ